MGKGIIVVGGTGAGKSWHNRELIYNKKHIVFDVNNEYLTYVVDKHGKRHEKYPKGFTRWKKVSDTEGFLNHIHENVTNTIVLIEEASIFFNNRKYNDDLNALLVTKRHQNNTYILVFHSLRIVPKFVLSYVDYLTLFKTNDTVEILSKYGFSSEVERAFIQVNNSPNPHETLTVDVRA